MAETKTTSSVDNLISTEQVQATLKADKGEKAQLISWETEDFTEQGDNYISYVTGVKVKFTIDAKVENTTYVVKVNPRRNFEAFEEFTMKMFIKEIDFYQNLAPELNSMLHATGQRPLRIPRCFHGSKEKGKELIFLEDLRTKGFKMARNQRQKGLDLSHALLVIQELGRLHSSSVLLQKRHPNEDLARRHPFLKLEWSDPASKERKHFNEIMSKGSEDINAMLNHIGGYDKVVAWITKHKDGFVNIMAEMIKRNPPFDVVCHGDIWNNNILFRYDDNGNPVEVTLIDLQGTRVAPLSTDLNHFLFTSLSVDARQPNIKLILTTYLETFKEVLEAGDMKVPFNFQELQQEYRNKHPFGLVYAKIVLPTIVLDSSETPGAKEIFGQVTEEESEEQKHKFLQLLNTDPLLRPRFLSVFDEMQKAGAFG